MSKIKLPLLNPSRFDFPKVIIIGKEEQSFLEELLDACNEENENSQRLTSNDTMILKCLINKVK